MANIFDLFKQISSADSDKGAPIEYIIVGLGNPGKDYERTRHNAGFIALDYISEKLGASVNRAKFNALCANATLKGKGVLLMKPQTYMNNSGEAVSAAARFYKIEPQNIIVISDDVNLDVGRMRVRKSGSAGGQKGLGSIIEHMGTEDIPRLRIGVGKKPHPDFDMKDWVLSCFCGSELAAIEECLPRAMSGVERMVSGDFDGAMQICNSK